eukprot:2169388-Amphidinium_carterae.1
MTPYAAGWALAPRRPVVRGVRRVGPSGSRVLATMPSNPFFSNCCSLFESWLRMLFHPSEEAQQQKDHSPSPAPK